MTLCHILPEWRGWVNRINTPKKATRKTDHSGQKQYRKHKDQLSKNNQKTNMEKKKTSVDTSRDKQAKSHMKNLEMAEKGKP